MLGNFFNPFLVGSGEFWQQTQDPHPKIEIGTNIWKEKEDNED